MTIDIEAKKRELGLIGMTDKSILKYALQCSQEIKSELKKRENTQGYKELIDSVAKADEIILEALYK